MDSIIFSDVTSRCLGLRINQLASRAAQLDWMANRLKAGAISKTQLAREQFQLFEYAYSVSIETLANDLILFGFVKEEVRAEETIYIDVVLTDCDMMFVVNEDSTITITKRDGKTLTVHTPRVEVSGRWITIRGKRPVQVRRKYYSWVG